VATLVMAFTDAVRKTEKFFSALPEIVLKLTYPNATKLNFNLTQEELA
jgi:hypothetical protein